MFRRLPAISVLAGVAVFVLCACDASGGSATSASTSGGARAGTSDVKANPTATPARWVLSMPASINGEQRLTDPDSQTRAELRQGIQQAEQNAGLTGRPAISGIYDDAADDAWLVVIGVNGAGFDSGQLVANIDAQQPGIAVGGSDETVTVKPATIGPHGGTAICEQTAESIDT